MISQALRIHQTTVTRHPNDYRADKLIVESGGSQSFLSESATAELVSHLEQKTYQTTQEIVIYIQDKYSVSYSVPGLNKWLHRNGFSYKKPKETPAKADLALQEEFKKNYNELKANLGEDEQIMFMDSCHPSMAIKSSYGWIKTGETKSIESTASRTRENIVGAINILSLAKAVICTYSTVDSDSIKYFKMQLRKVSEKSGTIHLVLEQAGYHSSEVEKLAEQLNIKLHFLPPFLHAN